MRDAKLPRATTQRRAGVSHGEAIHGLAVWPSRLSGSAAPRERDATASESASLLCISSDGLASLIASSQFAQRSAAAVAGLQQVCHPLTPFGLVALSGPDAGTRARCESFATPTATLSALDSRNMRAVFVARYHRVAAIFAQSAAQLRLLAPPACVTLRSRYPRCHHAKKMPSHSALGNRRSKVTAPSPCLGVPAWTLVYPATCRMVPPVQRAPFMRLDSDHQ